VALHPGAQGGAGRGRKRGDDDLRRGRPRRRRGGRQRDRRAPRPARAAIAGAGRDPLAPGRRARLAPLPDREEPRRRRHPNHRAQARPGRAPRGDRADAVGRVGHRRGPRAGGETAGGGVTAYVALLRGINLMGGTVLRMAELKALAAELGFDKPSTFIASGNLLFTSAKREPAVKAALEQALKAHMARDVGVMVRTAGEIAAVAAANPFAGEPANRVVAIFLDHAPPKDAAAQAKNVVDERMALGA